MTGVNFPPKTVRLISSIGISESIVLDVFHKGEQIKSKNGMVKRYNGYEVGLFYAQDKNTGEYIITYVWKRERR